MGEPNRIKPDAADLESAIKTYKQFAERAEELPTAAKNTVTAAAIDLLPESIKPYARAEMAAQYMVQAQGAEAKGNHAAAKVYTAIALHYMSQTGIRLDQVLPETAGKDDSSKYIASLFAKAPEYNPEKGGN